MLSDRGALNEYRVTIATALCCKSRSVIRVIRNFYLGFFSVVLSYAEVKENGGSGSSYCLRPPVQIPSPIVGQGDLKAMLNVFMGSANNKMF